LERFFSRIASLEQATGSGALIAIEGVNGPGDEAMVSALNLLTYGEK